LQPKFLEWDHEHLNLLYSLVSSMFPLFSVCSSRWTIDQTFPAHVWSSFVSNDD
jgi:hypothetical protein